MTEIIDASGYARSSIYRWIEQELIDLDKLHLICSICGVDVSGELPELDYYRSQLPRDKQPVQHVIDVVSKSKYVDLLEQLNDVRRKLEESQERYNKVAKKVTELEKELENKDKAGTN